MIETWPPAVRAEALRLAGKALEGVGVRGAEVVLNGDVAVHLRRKMKPAETLHLPAWEPQVVTVIG